MADCTVPGADHRKLGRRPFVDRTCLSVGNVAAVEEFTGKVYYVDPNNTYTSDDNEGTDPGRPMTTVQAAINRCEDHKGDAVVVMQTGAWQYDALDNNLQYINEEVTLDKAGVSLVGVSPGGTGVLWTPASDGGTCITVTAIDCLIDGFLFDEGDHTGLRAIYAEWDSPNSFGENLEVRNCVFDDSVDTAIEMEYTWYCHIHHNFFQECAAGIYTAADGSAIDYARIHDNVFQNCGYAIALLGGADNNEIFRNYIYNAYAENGAIATNFGINTTGGDYNMVSDNFLSCLLPVPANGDLNDFCTAAATDAWVGNHCLNGLQVTQPT